MTRRPNVLVILTDQQRYAPPYESDELAAYRREHLPGVERLRQNGVSFRHHYPMAAAERRHFEARAERLAARRPG
jgi:arylsulfatase A-like enzyme